MSEDNESFIPTRASSLKNDPTTNFQSITFNAHKSKAKRKNDEPQEIRNDRKDEEFNMKKARHEILKFAMSGFDATKKHEAKIQLAVKLGAKPPKNPYKNYKVLLQEKAKQKQEIKSEMEFQQLGKNKLGKSTAKTKPFDKKKRKDKGGILDIYGTVKTS